MTPKGNGTLVDPKIPFDVAGVTYFLELDTPDTYILRMKLSDQGAMFVAGFGPGYDPFEVYIAALEHRRDSLRFVQRLQQEDERAKQESGKLRDPKTNLFTPGS